MTTTTCLACGQTITQTAHGVWRDPDDHAICPRNVGPNSDGLHVTPAEPAPAICERCGAPMTRQPDGTWAPDDDQPCPIAGGAFRPHRPGLDGRQGHLPHAPVPRPAPPDPEQAEHAAFWAAIDQRLERHAAHRARVAGQQRAARHLRRILTGRRIIGVEISPDRIDASARTPHRPPSVSVDDDLALRLDDGRTIRISGTYGEDRELDIDLDEPRPPTDPFAGNPRVADRTTVRLHPPVTLQHPGDTLHLTQTITRSDAQENPVALHIVTAQPPQPEPAQIAAAHPDWTAEQLQDEYHRARRPLTLFSVDLDPNAGPDDTLTTLTPADGITVERRPSPQGSAGGGAIRRITVAGSLAERAHNAYTLWTKDGTPDGPDHLLQRIIASTT